MTPETAGGLAVSVLGLLLVIGAIADMTHTLLIGSRGAGPTERLRRLAVALLARHPPRRRGGSLVGPLQVLGSILTWNIVIMAGFALVYAPWLNEAVAAMETHAGPLEPWPDALYFSVGNSTVLGFGDLVPVHSWAKIVSGAQALIGFLTVTFVVTYAVSTAQRLLDQAAWIREVHDLEVIVSRRNEMVERFTAGAVDHLVGERLTDLSAKLGSIADWVAQEPTIAVSHRGSAGENLVEAVAAVDRVCRLVGAARSPWAPTTAVVADDAHRLLADLRSVMERADEAMRLQVRTAKDPTGVGAGQSG